MHDSFTPLGGMVPLVNIQLGELIFGGVGSGLYGMLVMAVLTVFIAGLMVGRTPEYLGKKIQSREVRMAMLYVLIFPAVILLLTAASAVLPAGLAGRTNAGPHGLSEILYAFSSVTGNNGSAFAGLTGGTYYYNTLLGLGTLFGRFAMMVPVLALAGFLAERRIVPASAGTFPVTSPRLSSPAPTLANRVRSPGSVSFRACVRLLERRRVSAWALPRPSAIASAKFANTTVNHSHSAIWSVNPRAARPASRSRRKTSVVSTLPTSTTNITGFRTMCRGSSFRNESRIARRTIGGSNRGRLVVAI